MMLYPYLIPECNVDTAFVEMLGYIRPNHAANIHEVCRILDGINTTQKAIGFIDNDKKKPPYLANFKVKEELDSFKLLSHSSKSQYLVVANPAMDRVIFNLCNRLRISPADYGFPRDFKAFLVCTKRESIKRDSNFKNLLNSIKQKKPPEIAGVISWIAKYYQLPVR